MSKIVKTASGKRIDMDKLVLQNENVIAVGNTKKNARGDLLGPGGKVVKTRDQIMKEYYALNTPIATDPPVAEPAKPIVNNPAKAATPTVAPVKKAAPAKPAINPAAGFDDEDFDTSPNKK